MVKVVINRCFGGFGLSDKAYERLIELGMTAQPYNEDGNLDEGVDISVHTDPKDAGVFGKYYKHWSEKERTDPRLVQVVEELGRKANDRFAELKIVEIPDDIEWTIEEYDGVEWIAEKHRTWR